MVFVKQRWKERRLCCSVAFAVAAAVLLLFGGETLWLFWLAALLHELGHLLALRLLRGRVEQLRFRLSGAEICYSGCSLSYGGEVLLALAGPGMNLALACLGALLAKWMPVPWLYRFVGCHLSLALFNLLPALPLDGGRVLKALLEARFPLYGEQAAGQISAVFGIFLSLAGIVILAKGGNPTLFFAGLVVLRRVLPKKPLHPAGKLLK